MSQINTISLTGSLTIGGSRPIIVPKTLTANGTYSAGTDNADGYSPVTVNVPERVPVVTYQVEQGIDGFNPVTVNVPIPTINSLNVTENGTYTAPSGEAYDEVVVNVPQVKYILYGEQTAADSNWNLGVVPLNTVNMFDNSYFNYDSANKRLIALKSFTALVTSWVYNLHSSNSRPEFESRLNGSRITYFNSSTSEGAIGGNNKIINVNVGDYIDLVNIENAGWGFGRIKIYDMMSNNYINYEE